VAAVRTCTRPGNALPVAVRPLAVIVSLWRAGLSRRELYAATWFGPKGFASVVYGLLAAQSGIADAETVFEFAALGVSIVARSMSEVPVSHAFDVQELRPRQRPARASADHSSDSERD
jgi:NhaP-type Na+/H+ or K+/H+ antiporter